MPQLADRDQHEQAIQADLAAAFAAQVARLRSGNNPRWDQFRVDVQQALQRQIQPILLTVGAGMPNSSASPELLLLGHSYTGSMLASMQLADEITRKSMARLAMFEPLETVFSEARARRIAVTETTRAVSQGEHFAAATFRVLDAKPLRPIWRTAIRGVCQFCDDLEGNGPEVYGVDCPDGPPAHGHCQCYLDWE